MTFEGKRGSKSLGFFEQTASLTISSAMTDLQDLERRLAALEANLPKIDRSLKMLTASIRQLVRRPEPKPCRLLRFLGQIRKDRDGLRKGLRKK